MLRLITGLEEILRSMLNHGDGGKFKGPGIFFFTPGMPVMLLENLMTPMKLVNGRIGTAIDIVIDPKRWFSALLFMTVLICVQRRSSI